MNTSQRTILFIENRGNYIGFFKAVREECFGPDVKFEYAISIEKGEERIHQGKLSLIVMGGDFPPEDKLKLGQQICANHQNLCTPILSTGPSSGRRKHLMYSDWSLSEPFDLSDLKKTVEIFSRAESSLTLGLQEWKKKRNFEGVILAMNDDRNVLDTIADLIKDSRSVVLEPVMRAEDAIRQINEKQYNLIITDIKHPGPDGVEIAKLARSSRRNGNTPILLCSAISSKREYCFFDLAVRLPMHVEEFRRAVELLLGKGLPPWQEIFPVDEWDLLQPGGKLYMNIVRKIGKEDAGKLLERSLWNTSSVGYEGERSDAIRPDRSEDVMDLIERRAEVSSIDSKSQTDLMVAAETDSIHKAQLLLSRGADVNAKDNKGTTALMLSTEKGYIEFAQLLIEAKADVDVCDYRGQTALTHAAAKGQANVAEFLIHCGAEIDAIDESGETALVSAVRNGDTDTARVLLEGSPDVNVKDRDGLTVLMVAASYLRSEILDLLLAWGADIHMKGNGGLTALMYAVKEQRIRNVRSLLNHGAELDQRNDEGKTALFIAVTQNDLEMVQILIDNGADVSAKDNEGHTVLFSRFINARIFDCLTEAGASVIEMGNNGITPLLDATWRGDRTTADLLMDADADTYGLGRSGILRICNASPKIFSENLTELPYMYINNDTWHDRWGKFLALLDSKCRVEE